ncbi:hypothetical protein ACF3NX_12700 [Acetobacter orientalis]|uniref:hypothetical protein n=1 Tax=Acetobacter orientalis TaxID=146474 RepID=UPI00386D9756
MAIEVITVDQDRREAGYELLEKTDAFGFNAIGAGWYKSAPEGRWRFFLVTPMIDSRGPKWVYDRLMSALRVVKIPRGIKPLEIHLASPREERFYDLRKKLRIPDMPKTAEVNLFHAHGDDLERLGIYAIVLYRMGDMDPRAGDTARIFDSRVKKLLAA